MAVPGLGPSGPPWLGPATGLPGRPHSDLGRIGGTTAAAVGRTLVGNRASSRPASCDPPISPGQGGANSPWRGQGSDQLNEWRPQRLREDSASRQLEMPSLDPSSPDSLTELLGLHSRPSSYGSRNNGAPGVCIPASMLQGINSPLSNGPSLQRSCRPGSREPELAGGTRPPRAPNAAVGIAGAPGINSQVGSTSHGGSAASTPPANVSGGGSLSEGRQRTRAVSHPREAASRERAQGSSRNSPVRRHSSGPAANVGSSVPANAPAHGVPPSAALEGRPITPRADRPPLAPGKFAGAAVSPSAAPGRHGEASHAHRSPTAEAGASPAYPGAAQTAHASRAVSSSAPPWGCRDSPQTVSLVSVAQDANEEFRSYMEDGHHVTDPLLQRGCRGKEDCWGFFGVYDGHGGRKEVDYVQAKLHEVVLAELRLLTPEKDFPEGLRRALVTAFSKIDSQLAMLGAWESGCTCTVVLTQRHARGLTLHVANVGDSRAVVVGNIAAKRLSVDHRACDPEEAKRVAQEGGMVRHGRVGGQLSVSRSLGDHHLKSSGVSCVPDIQSFEVSQEHAVVIASDGLWDALEDDDARDVLGRCIDEALSQGSDQEAIAKYLRDQAARTLVETAKERGSRDNILALVAFF